MNNENLITLPPPELVKQWTIEGQHYTYETPLTTHISTQASRWGADRELDACCEWLEMEGRVDYAAMLRCDRRPKPPSFKQQAQRILVENGTTLDGRMELEPEDIEILKAALELLPDEAQ